jgi:predicted DNA binding protein
MLIQVCQVTILRLHGIDFDVMNIHDLTGHSGSRVGLTDCQQMALQVAAERGYYTVPRETTADELAEEFGISHQALSERLRRAHGNLVHQILGTRNEGEEQTDIPPAKSRPETNVD